LDGKFLLYFDGALHGLHDASKLGDDGIAPGVDDTAIVAVDQRSHGRAVAAQNRQGACFIGFHQSAIAFNISAQDRREPSLYLYRHAARIVCPT